MSWLSFLDPAVGAVMSPLLDLPPLLAVGIVALLMTLILTLAYKYLTDQQLMRQLKEEIQALQKQTKELKEHPEEMMKVQKKAMEANMKYMMQSLKPTLLTMIPIILFFGWMQSAYAFDPIQPGSEFTVTASFLENTNATLEAFPEQGITLLTAKTQPIVDNKASWGLKAETGNYQVKVSHKEAQKSHDIRVDEKFYKQPVSVFEDASIREIAVDMKKRIVLNLFGWKLGWLGTYFILSIILSIGLRKILKVY